MKKKLLFLSAIAAITSLTGCNKENHINNQAEVDALKALLNKQDLSPFYEKSFSAMYNQSYSVYSNNIREDGEDIQFFRYNGTGMYGYYYSVTQEQYEKITSQDEVNPFDFMVQGTSAYDIRQSLDVDSYSFESDEQYSEPRENRQTFEYWQSLTALFSNGNFQVDTKVTIDDKLDNNHDEMLDFNGIIANETLLETVTTSALNELFLQMEMFDGQRNTEFLDNLYYQTCEELLNKTDREISDFININHIEIKEGEANTEVSFKIEDESIRNILSENDVFPGIIEGTLTYDKETGEYKSYSYNINYMNNEISEDGSSIHNASMKFSCEGYSTHKKYEGSIYVRPDPVEYTSGEEYVSTISEKAIPSLI